MDKCNLDDCDGYVCLFYSIHPDAQKYITQLEAVAKAARDIDEYVDLSPEDIPENHKYCAYCGYKKPDGHWKVCPMNALQEKLEALDEEDEDESETI